MVNREIVGFWIEPRNRRCDRSLLGRIGGERREQRADLLNDRPCWHRPEFTFERQLLDSDDAIAGVLGRELTEEIERRLFLAGDAAQDVGSFFDLGRRRVRRGGEGLLVKRCRFGLEIGATLLAANFIQGTGEGKTGFGVASVAQRIENTERLLRLAVGEIGLGQFRSGAYISPFRRQRFQQANGLSRANLHFQR